MVKINFEKNIPTEIRSAIEPLVNDLAWLIPGWCQYIDIRWQEENPQGAFMQCGTNYAYRWVSITVFPQWLMQEDSERKECLVHEIIHGLNAPLADWIREVIKTLAPEETEGRLQTILMDELVQRNESFVQDMAFAISKMPRVDKAV